MVATHAKRVSLALSPTGTGRTPDLWCAPHANASPRHRSSRPRSDVACHFLQKVLSILQGMGPGPVLKVKVWAIRAVPLLSTQSVPSTVCSVGGRCAGEQRDGWLDRVCLFWYCPYLVLEGGVCTSVRSSVSLAPRSLMSTAAVAAREGGWWRQSGRQPDRPDRVLCRSRPGSCGYRGYQA